MNSDTDRPTEPAPCPPPEPSLSEVLGAIRSASAEIATTRAAVLNLVERFNLLAAHMREGLESLRERQAVLQARFDVLERVAKNGAGNGVGAKQ